MLSPMSVEPHAWVFAYGSNMHTGDLSRWLAEHGYPDHGIQAVAAACLSDYGLVWDYDSKARHGGAANAEPRAGSLLHGVALAVDRQTLEAIDVKEGHPHRYSRGEQPLLARLATGEPVHAWLYVVQPEFRKPAPVRPRPEYLALMVQAAKDHGLPAQYVAALEQTETQS